MPKICFPINQNDYEKYIIKHTEWFDIPHYNLYKISKNGLVKRVHSVVTASNGTLRTIRERLMRTKVNKDGYISLTLSENGIQKGEFIHVLLAKTFIPNPHNYPIVNHIDENPSNNSLDNLEWCTYKQNALHSIKKIKKAHDKEKRIVIRINPKTKETIEYNGIREAALLNNIDHNNIRYSILHNGYCAGYKWAYKYPFKEELDIISKNKKYLNVVIVTNTNTHETKKFYKVSTARHYMKISQTHFYRLIKANVHKYHEFVFETRIE